MKNAYRITAKIPVNENIPLARGAVSAAEWVRMEAARLTAAGIEAAAVTAGGVCWVSRSREGCAVMGADEGAA